MNYRKTVLKLTVLALGLATLHFAAAPARAMSPICPDVAIFCDDGNAGGYCGYEYGEDCRACYGFDGSVTYGTGCGSGPNGR